MFLVTIIRALFTRINRYNVDNWIISPHSLTDGHSLEISHAELYVIQKNVFESSYYVFMYFHKQLSHHLCCLQGFII